MKKTLKICITITVIIMLVGCSNANKDVYNKATPNSSDTTSENITSKQSQLQSKDKSVSIEDTNSDLLEGIDTTKSPFERGYYDYEGTINTNIPIRMSIYPLGKDIVGTYFYEKNKNETEIKLQGKSGKEKIVLYEYDEAGKNTGIFQGTMSTIDKIEGTWISSDHKISYPFVLSLESNIPGAEYGKRYSLVTNNKSDQDVENYVSKIKNYILNDNKEQLAEEIEYPINVVINSKKVQIKNKDDLINNYDKIFTVDYKKAISNAPTRYLFTNYQGVMLGNGEVWINDIIETDDNYKLMIIAINTI